jgi:hypothetical protein
MNAKPKSIPQPAPGDSLFPIGLAYQTGMPPIYHSRSKELRYDVLINQPTFIFNPFGPQLLGVSRSNHHW